MQTQKTLAGFQTAFAQALWVPPHHNALVSGAVAALASQPGFAVYRNTVMKSCIDALQANYPAVARLTGDEWFRAAAAIYVRESPPDDPSLLNYGELFAAFLSRYLPHAQPAASLPYVAGVARLDRLWTEAHTARDETPLDAAVIANLAPAKLATAVLYPHAAARWAWFADAPVFSIWAHHRAAERKNDEAWQPARQIEYDHVGDGEGALLTRPRGTVEWVALDAAGCAFLDRCANGGTLAEAARDALAAQHGADLQQLMAALLHAGAFNRMSVTQRR